MNESPRLRTGRCFVLPVSVFGNSHDGAVGPNGEKGKGERGCDLRRVRGEGGAVNALDFFLQT